MVQPPDFVIIILLWKHGYWMPSFCPSSTLPLRVELEGLQKQLFLLSGF